MPKSGQSTEPKKSLFARFVSGAVWTALGRLSGTFGLLLVLSAVTRILSADDAGIYVVYQSTALFGAIVAGFGVAPIVIRMIHSTTEQRAFRSLRAGIRRIMMMNIIGSLIVASVGTILIFVLDDNLAHGHLQSHLFIAIAWMVLSVLSQTIGEVFRGLGHFGWAAIIGGQTGGMILNPLLAAVVILLPETNVAIATVLQLQISIMGIVFGLACIRLFFLVRKLPQTEPATTILEEPTLRWLVSESWPIAVTQVLVLGVVPLNILILGSVGTTKNAALFSAAYQIMMLIGAPLQILNIALPPFITELFGAGKKRELESLLRFSATSAGIPALAALSIVMLWPEETLNWLFGREFRDAATALVILVAANTVFVFCGSCGLTLQLTGNQRMTMWNSLITVSVYLLILPLMISTLELVGAAICAGARIVVGNLVCLILVKKHVGIWGSATFWPNQALSHIQTIRQFTKTRTAS